MLAPEMLRYPSQDDETPVVRGVLPEELEFYGGYAWCLNPHLTVREAVDRLRDEIDRLAILPRVWQTGEVVTNVLMLSCGLLNCLDEYLRGPSLRVPQRLASTPVGRGARWTVDNIVDRLRPRSRVALRRWRNGWLAGLDGFLSVVVAGASTGPAGFAVAGAKLATQLRSPLPGDLQARRLAVPSAFRRLDLTHLDVLALGRSYVRRFPDRSQPILLVGLRTSGSYFVPLLQALLNAEGYAAVASLTLAPSKGPGCWERGELKRHAERGYTALIVDDAPRTGATIFTALEILRRAGFGRRNAKALVPAHPANRHWFKPLPDDMVVSLEPEHWHKRTLLESGAVEARLAEYFRSEGSARATVVASGRAEAINARLQDAPSDERGSRLKRVFEVQLETPQGQQETRYVLAKSVGWGWLGYHAFLAGHRLAGFVPPLLGLRDGILYMEWIARPEPEPEHEDRGRRTEWIDTAASYVAARARCLGLETGSVANMELPRQDNGTRLLARVLSKAYGAFVTDILMQPRLGRLLRRQPCPLPILIDGNMRRTEWIAGSHGWLKTDYEHHGLGKEELNVVDPAYDLADAMLQFELSPEEENRLIRRYVGESGDVGVEQRLFPNKLLAGLWTMKQAQELLFCKAHSAEEQQAIHRRFLRAWNFLTVEAARYCGDRCRPADLPRWRSPIVALDIDGVIDRRLFGFPCTTAAGIEALRLLHAHQVSVAVNTARSVAEVQAYCRAYSLAGGVAEHGSYVWDAVHRRGRALIDPETVRQLDELRRNLRRVPGVFLDDRHQYSIRAFTYQDKPRGLLPSLMKSVRSHGIGDAAVAPLPTLLVQHLMTDLRLDRLCFHHTSIDTAILAKEADKGSGLAALRDWVLGTDAETIAVGDEEPDLAMFRVATRSFAPANIGCARHARLFGCRVVHAPFQRGLIEIARAVAHPDGHECERCAQGKIGSRGPDLFIGVLRAADRTWAVNLMRTLFGLHPGPAGQRAGRLFFRPPRTPAFRHSTTGTPAE